MKFACPVEGTWTVEIAGSHKYTLDGAGGPPLEYVDGRCESCGSRVLVEPSDEAVKLATTRVTAMHAAGKIAKAPDG
jgi:hypothetical protein